MNNSPQPTIKGVYVNSHVDALRQSSGDEAVKRLEEMVGFPTHFPDDEDVFTADEERIIDKSLLILHPDTNPVDLHYLSGRLHFTNWTATPWSKQLFGLLPQDFRYMMLHQDVISIKVFKNAEFRGEEVGPTEVRVITTNNYYHPDHWRGIYQAWMEAFGLQGAVTTEVVGDHAYNYLIAWKAPEVQS